MIVLEWDDNLEFKLRSLSRGLLCANGNSPVGRHPSEGSPH